MCEAALEEKKVQGSSPPNPNINIDPISTTPQLSSANRGLFFTTILLQSF
jgi:hypothetical protein